MSGHSKFSTIKHHKAIQDSKRAKLFLNILRRISHEAGRDPNQKSNNNLRNWILVANKNNIPKRTITKAIERTNKENQTFSELVYEGFFRGKICFIVECLTNNINRTNSEIKAMFKRCGASLSTVNGCRYLFEKVFLVTLASPISQSLVAKIQNECPPLYTDESSTQHQFYYFVEQAEEATFFFNNQQMTPLLANVAYRVIAPLVTISDDHLCAFQKFYERVQQLDDVEHMWTNVSLEMLSKKF